jgi:protein-L-isoaspartate(D-aspartate) O-methyltransferase
MTEQLRPKQSDRVLEIGSGSGYQAAILGELVAEVYTIEIVEPLAKSAEATLQRLGYNNVHIKVGDGYKGWPEEAPFDAIIVTCAPEKVPQPLVDQLKDGGAWSFPSANDSPSSFIYSKRKTGS